MNAGTMRIRSRGQHPAGGIQVKNEKNRPSLKTVKNDNKSEKTKYKPLWGKVFYLDLPSVVLSERLEKDLKELGGRVEEFLSKDISYLISNKKEAKYAQTLRCISPVPSPESTYTGGNTSPHPSCDGSSFKTPEPVCMSRGKLLVEKAIKEHEFIPSNSILSNALSWGVKILHIDDIKYYIEQKKKEFYLLKKSSASLKEVGKRSGNQKTKTGKLKKPFVKVEDTSHHYRPFYLQLSNIPLINYSVPKPCSPFDLEKASSLQKQTQAKPRNRVSCEPDEGRCPPLQPRLKENKKKGYCECCSQKYEALQAHLLSEKHRNFAQSTQYQVVDDIISKLVYDFVEYKSNISRRVKSSIGSFTPIAGNSLKKSEPEKLELHHDFQNDHWGNTAKPVLPQESQHPESGDAAQKVAFTSEHIHSLPSCSPCPHSSTSKPREHMDCRESYIINPVEKDTELPLLQLPLNKDIQGNTPEVSEYQETFNEKSLEELKTECCPYILETFIQVSDFDETDKNVSQLKRKSDDPLFSDSCQKKKNAGSPQDCGSSLRVLGSSPEDPPGQVKMVSPSHSGEEPKDRDISSTDSLPSGKLHRKVKIVLGRNKRSQKKNVELLVKNKTEFPAAKEESSTCSSPIQSLMELFQTSENNSEFLGFTSYSEDQGSCDVLEVWEEENENSLLSMFLSSPSSASTFTGF